MGQQLRLALAETIILDFDDLPRAEVELGGAPAPSGTASGTNTDRAAQFPRLDKHADGILSRGEFSAGRAPEQAVCFFTRRDTDANGVLGREEYLPTAVPRATPE